MKIYERLAELVEKRQKFVLVGLEECKEVDDIDYYLHKVFAAAIALRNASGPARTHLYGIHFYDDGGVGFSLAYASNAEQPTAVIFLTIYPPDYSAARITPSGLRTRHPTADLLTSILQEEVPDETTQEAG